MKRTALALCLLPLPVMAQIDDRSYLTAFLEDNLSGAGRQVVITGFEGALSSQARIAELTIADDAGVWLRLGDVVLDWNRAALLSGHVSVNELSAAKIELLRLPQPGDDAPAPEAGTFSLPELPVSVEIGRVAADQIILGPAVLGQPVTGQFQASATLSGGAGAIDLVLERSDDGPEGELRLAAAYSNETARLDIDLRAAEGAGGLVAQALDLPGQPASALTLTGSGPFGGFVADVTLATDQVPRLAGRIVTQAATGQTGFAVNLSGDVAPLFLPDYAAFFGPKVGLLASGTAHADGRVDLTKLNLTARALDLSGSLALDANRNLRAFDLQGRVAEANGGAVLLPLTTDLPVRVQGIDLNLNFDRAKGDGWSGHAQVTGLERADLAISQLALSGSGRLQPGQFGATLRFDGEGVQPRDAALARALGSVLSGDAVVIWRQADGALAIPRLTLAGEDYGLTVTGGRIGGLASGIELRGKAEARLSDLTRFQGLTGQALTGAADLQVTGRYMALTGALALNFTADGRDIQTGQQMLDGLLRGRTHLSGRVDRDQTGTRITEGALSGNGVDGRLNGQLSSADSDLTATLDLRDLSALGPGFGGQIALRADLTGPLPRAHVVVSGQGQRLRSGNPELDKLLSGDSQLAADLDLMSGAVRIRQASLTNGELSATVNGQADGAQQVLDVQARLRNLGVLLPEFPGPLTIQGKVTNSVAGATVDLSGKGPGGIDATVKGDLRGGRADLALRGQAQAALANAFVQPRNVSGQTSFDLRLNGPLALSSLSGQVTLQGGRITDPALAFAFDGVSARADLSGGQARITATLPLTTAGKLAVAGTVGLAEPFSAALGIALQGIVLRDPDLYEARLGGELKLTGPLLQRPLLSGRIDLAETELRVPSTGFGGAAGLPDLRHVAEPAAVRATRARAGLLAEAAQSARTGGSDLALDLLISAPNRLFIRGRGLDAELGGEVRLLGSLSALSPSGAFNLIRGRLEILGKRFDLDEALLQMEGDLVPFLRVVASTENDGITSNVVIEGRADDPKVSFTSMPELPEEEVLAQLLFGQGLQNLSALQALQLANAVATLAGKGGEGVLSRLRSGAGLDNLDVKTNADGGAEVTAGKYIGKNAYTEVTVGQDGKSQINLNLDLTDSITLRGRAGSDGQTGLGVFLEKDY